LLNVFRYGVLSFQYISHRVLRWTLAPLCLPLLFIASLSLAVYPSFYFWMFAGQVLFYGLGLAGAAMSRRKTRLKALFVPYYFMVMNYSVYAAFFRFKRGKQSVLWEKARRSTLTS